MDDPAKIKRDYFVPHFGTDNEINGIADSLKAAEGSLGHKLEVKGSLVGIRTVFSNGNSNIDTITVSSESARHNNRLGLARIYICASRFILCSQTI